MPRPDDATSQVAASDTGVGSSRAAVRVSALTYTYLDTDTPSLVDVDLTVEAGRSLGVVGPVGAGKTTLCLCLAGMMPRVFGGDVEGTVEVAGIDPISARASDLGSELGVVFEDYTAQLTQITVIDEVAAPLVNRGVAREEAWDRAREVLAEVGLDEPGLERRRTWELSGGQQQRLVIAAALATQPSVLVLDSVTTMLDPAGTVQIRDLVRRLVGGRTVVVVDDDVDFLLGLVDDVLLLAEGRVVTSGPAGSVLRQHDLLTAHGVVPPAALRAAQRLGLPGAPLDRAEFQQVASDRLVPVRGRAEHSSPPLDGSVALQVEDVHYAYPDGTPALQGASLVLRQGEVHGLLGGNGAGKTTLSKVITGLVRPDRGRVLIGGSDVTDLRAADRLELVGTAFQNPDDMITERTVRGEIGFTLRALQHERLGRFGKQQRYGDDLIEQRVAWACEVVGIDAALLDADPSLLPFGFRKLVTIAAAIARRPPVVVFDEPGTGLDAAARLNLARAVRRLREENMAVLLVEHEIDLVTEIADSVTVMEEGRAGEQGSTVEVFQPEQWERLARLHILPPSVAELGRAIGVFALSIDDLAAATSMEMV